eukprot:3932507-Rhodomonas_salina.3
MFIFHQQSQQQQTAAESDAKKRTPGKAPFAASNSTQNTEHESRRLIRQVDLYADPVYTSSTTRPICVICCAALLSMGYPFAGAHTYDRHFQSAWNTSGLECEDRRRHGFGCQDDCNRTLKGEKLQLGRG